jgi:heme/copper-type cytochrome/quinol oxidase subunit 3
VSAIPWTYEQRPDTRTTNVRVGIWLFLASEAMLFGSLFSGYVLLRAGAETWPKSGAFLDMRSALMNTVLLAMVSALLMASGGRRNAPAEAGALEPGFSPGIGLYLSAAIAVLFLASKFFEYQAKLDAGHPPSLNLLLACWFTLTFVHALHVGAGAGANLWLAWGRSRMSGAQFRERWRAVRLYWYFVDVVWIAILIAFYFI